MRLIDKNIKQKTKQYKININNKWIKFQAL